MKLDWMPLVRVVMVLAGLGAVVSGCASTEAMTAEAEPTERYHCIDEAKACLDGNTLQIDRDRQLLMVHVIDMQGGPGLTMLLDCKAGLVGARYDDGRIEGPAPINPDSFVEGVCQEVRGETAP